MLIHVLNNGVVFNRHTIELLLSDAGGKAELRPHLSIGPLRIDLARRLVEYDSRRVQLTPREFALLISLSRNTDHIVTFDQLLNEAWGYDPNRSSPAQVRLYIARLRHKLMTQAEAPNFIQTERGMGYRLKSEVLRRASLNPERSTSRTTVSNKDAVVQAGSVSPGLLVESSWDSFHHWLRAIPAQVETAEARLTSALWQVEFACDLLLLLRLDLL